MVNRRPGFPGWNPGNNLERALRNYCRRILSRCKSERGMALLATMMAIALMTIIVVDFTSSSALGYLSAANNANEIRATYLARSAVNVGLALIAQDTRAQLAAQQSGQSGQSAGGTTGQTTQQGSSSTTGQGPFDSLASVWAIPFPPMPVNGGTIALSVTDEARKFNINRMIIMQPGGSAPTTGAVTPGGSSLGSSAPIGSTSGTGLATGTNAATLVGQPNPTAITQFTALIGILGLNPDIVPCVLDWLDADSIELPNGAESDYYLGLKPPYQPRNGLMPTLGDLRLVKGVDDATFATLRNFVTVAPETAVNPNTASPQVLEALEPELVANPDIVKQIIEARSVRPFTAVTELMNEVPSAAAISKLSQDLTVRGNYFTITGVGNYAGARKLVFATFMRNSDGTGTLGSWQED